MKPEARDREGEAKTLVAIAAASFFTDSHESSSADDSIAILDKVLQAQESVLKAESLSRFCAALLSPGRGRRHAAEGKGKGEGSASKVRWKMRED